MLNEIRTNNRLMLTMLVGLILRVLFVLVGAKFYFGRENIFVDGDTQVWVACIQNLIETGTYTMNPGHEYGYFGRTPGYSFFIGIFYLLTGKDWNAAYPLIAWTQVVLDVIAIYFVYKIGLKLLNGDKKSAAIPAFLYATYPFVIVWNPVVYSELLSIFFLIIGLYYFIYEEKKYNYFFAGVFVSLSVLCRPQVLLMIGVMGLVILIKKRKNIYLLFRNLVQFGLAVLIVYGSWPIRNYVNYNKMILTQDLRGWSVADKDWIAFTQYLYSVKAEWQPQFDDLIHNRKVTFPEESYLTTDDSLKLERAIYLSQNCGSSFSNWRGYWKEPITGENCNLEIKQLFDELRMKQITSNPINFYIVLPLKNLSKALFKYKLYDTETIARKLASLLFIFRTLLILLGILGLINAFITKMFSVELAVVLLYFILLYLSLCFGTGPQFRNIEMRYFLPADVLLLFPTSIVLRNLSEKFKHNNG
jgi:hypothetical protein